MAQEIIVADKPTLDQIKTQIDSLTASLSQLTTKVNNIITQVNKIPTTQVSGGGIKGVQLFRFTLDYINSRKMEKVINLYSTINPVKSFVILGGTPFVSPNYMYTPYVYSLTSNQLIVCATYGISNKDYHAELSAQVIEFY